MLRVFLVFSLWVSSLVLASAEFVPLQERAAGQSLTGASVLNDSLYSNPAGSAFQNVYSLDGTYVLKKGFAVSILDTRTSSLGGALGYFRMPIEGKEDLTQGAKAAVFNRISQKVGIGMSGKMIWSPSFKLDAAQKRTTEKLRDEKLMDVDIGMLTSLGMVEFGTTLKNALGGNKDLDAGREMAVGGRINWNQLLYLSATIVSKVPEYITPYKYGVGTEFITPYYFSIKGGWSYEPGLSQTTWSAGASFISPRFNIHYALEMPQYTNATSEHTLGMTVFL